MTRFSDEPSRAWQTRCHQQISGGDPIAFAQLCEKALPHLTLFLRRQFPQAPPHLHDIAAIDCLMSYHGRPQQFNPDKLSLFAYLRMAARGDIRNALDSRQRREKRLHDLDDPAIQTQLTAEQMEDGEFELDDWLAQHTHLTRPELWARVEARFDDGDKEILSLMLQGVRDGRQFAQIMGISHLDLVSQRQAVKRAKDRIGKKLKRLGNQLDGK